jgi:hypothetical protein
MAAGLGLFVGGLALFGTGRGQKLIANLARHLPETHAMTSLEEEVMENHYTMKTFLDVTKAEMKRKAAANFFADSPDVRDALVELGKRRYNPNIFLRAHNNPSALADEIVTAAGSDLATERQFIEDRLSQAVRLNRGDIRALRQQFRAVREASTIEMLGKHKPNEGLFGFRPLTVSDALDGKYQFTREKMYAHGRSVEPGEQAFQERMLRSMARRNNEFRNAPLDPGLFINRHGEVVDVRSGLDRVHKAVEGSSKFHLPFVGISPYDILKLGKKAERQSMPFMQYFRKGSVMNIFGDNPEFVTKEITELGPIFRSNEDMLLMGKNLYSITNPGKILANDVRLTPSQYGQDMQTMVKVAGYRTKEDNRNALFKILDLGGQESNSEFAKLKNLINKKKNDNWEGNILRNIIKEQSDSRLNNEINKMRRSVAWETRAMPNDVFEAVFGERARQIHSNMDFSSEEGILNAFEEIAK